MQDWFPLVQEDGRSFRTGICWCRKVVAGSGLVVAGTELVAVGICWCKKVIAGAGRRLPVQISTTKTVFLLHFLSIGKLYVFKKERNCKGSVSSIVKFME